MQNLGVFHSLGDVWIKVLSLLSEQGSTSIYTDNAGEEADVKELFDLTLKIQDATLPDEGYIPCVSLLDFQESGGRLNMTAYCRALDFGCKAYVNLVMLHLIQKEIAEKTGMMQGQMTLIIKLAHFYRRDEEKVERILKAENIVSNVRSFPRDSESL